MLSPGLTALRRQRQVWIWVRLRPLLSKRRMKQFPSIRLAREALRSGDAAPIVLNAANEIAVHHFLNYNIPFLAISQVVEETLNRQTFKDPKSIYDVTLIDFETRKITEDLVRSIRTAN